MSTLSITRHKILLLQRPSCHRHWTHGGVFRNIPVGGGTRKNTKRQKLINPTTSGYVTTSSSLEYQSLVPPPHVDAAGNVMVLFEGNGFMSLLEVAGFEDGVWPFVAVNVMS
ncbi:dof zinc finger protein DOF3.4 [Artemisia annua]|uniref:Dof zinc finger protein DOF3.4 n=1 Tax=Artemisia annua TaxID=35608 RepID=A0A2U1MZQ6_ARTAN|nr:dof zinc finger protein DOF3.4 [Artemisia annua]